MLRGRQGLAFTWLREHLSEQVARGACERLRDLSVSQQVRHNCMQLLGRTAPVRSLHVHLRVLRCQPVW